MKKLVPPLLGILLASTLGACASMASPASMGAQPSLAEIATARVAEVHHSPTCTCCTEYAAYLRRNGWTVDVIEEADITEFQSALGIPESAQGCHVTLFDDYLVSGHVPLAAIDRLLAERPSVDGIGLPGMPLGSPGMTGSARGPLVVVSFDDGGVSPFGEY
jgi:hypothetical protein